MNEDEMKKELLTEFQVFSDLKYLSEKWEKDKIPRESYIELGLAMFIGELFINSSSIDKARDILINFIKESHKLEQQINELKTQKENR